MPTEPTPRRRTIGMPAIRSKQIALCAAYCGMSSERWIQASVTTAMLSLAEHDKAFSLMLMRAGTDWESLAQTANADAQEKVL